MFDAIFVEKPTALQALLVVGLTVLFSSLFAAAYVFLKRKDGIHKDIPVALVLFPVIVSFITIITSSLIYNFNGTTTEIRYFRTGVALFSAVVLIRFRSQQRTIEDLTYLFFSAALGIIFGMGYVVFGCVFFATIMCLVALIYVIRLSDRINTSQRLKITIPEDLSFENAFDEVFDKYTSSHKLVQVKSSDMGTLFVLVYDVQLKKGTSAKMMLDDIRVKNSNLNVILVSKKYLDD